MAKKNWIQKANLKEGAFSAKAKKAGYGTQTYASRVLANPEKYDSKTVKQANLARTFKKMSK